jgi:hypothetical protein
MDPGCRCRRGWLTLTGRTLLPGRPALRAGDASGAVRGDDAPAPSLVMGPAARRYGSERAGISRPRSGAATGTRPVRTAECAQRPPEAARKV